MGILSNGFRDTLGAVQFFGATASNNAYPSARLANFARTGAARNITAGEGINSGLVSLPSGNRHPSAWMMPQKPGALAARNSVTGEGGVTEADTWAVKLAQAALTGSGSLEAIGGLIVQLIADIAQFKKDRGLSRCVAVWCGSTEVYQKPAPCHATLADFDSSTTCTPPCPRTLAPVATSSSAPPNARAPTTSHRASKRATITSAPPRRVTATLPSVTAPAAASLFITTHTPPSPSPTAATTSFPAPSTTP